MIDLETEARLPRTCERTRAEFVPYSTAASDRRAGTDEGCCAAVARPRGTPTHGGEELVGRLILGLAVAAWEVQRPGRSERIYAHR